LAVVTIACGFSCFAALIIVCSVGEISLKPDTSLRSAKVQGDSILYELTLKGKAALKLDKKSIEEFLQTATDEQLSMFIVLF